MAFEYLAAYATFDSVADMDEQVEQHIQQHYYDLTDSERAVVFAIASRSLMHPGASHLKASTIADVLQISTKTVYRTVKKLDGLGIIEKVPGVKLNGIKGANIYRILPNVPSEVSQRAVVEEAIDDAVNHPKSENQSLDSFNLLSSKQANNIICVSEELALQAEKKKEYMNEWQVTLFDFLHSLPMRDDLKDQLHKVVLASQIECPRGFVRAKDALLNIVRDINSGVLTVSTTLRAVFAGARGKAMERLSNPVAKCLSADDEPIKVKRVPFYNWLIERDDVPRSISRKSGIDNWLEW